MVAVEALLPPHYSTSRLASFLTTGARAGSLHGLEWFCGKTSQVPSNEHVEEARRGQSPPPVAASQVSRTCPQLGALCRQEPYLSCLCLPGNQPRLGIRKKCPELDLVLEGPYPGPRSLSRGRAFLAP